ncbi:hypothetical protein Dimus_012397 [Dionaea muscipula]
MWITAERDCVLCKAHVETVNHLLFMCEYSQAVLCRVLHFIKLPLPRLDWRCWIWRVTRGGTPLARMRRVCLAAVAGEEQSIRSSVSCKSAEPVVVGEKILCFVKDAVGECKSVRGVNGRFLLDCDDLPHAARGVVVCTMLFAGVVDGRSCAAINLLLAALVVCICGCDFSVHDSAGLICTMLFVGVVDDSLSLRRPGWLFGLQA